MYKHKEGGAVSAVWMALAISPLAACDSGHLEKPGTKFADPGFPVQHESGAGLARPTAAEHRHFDFYTRYRAMFDAAPEGLAANVLDFSDGIVQDAGMARGSPTDAGPSCSMRMLLMKD